MAKIIHYAPATGHVLATYPPGTAVTPPDGYLAIEADDSLITEVVDAPDVLDLTALPPPPSLADIKAAAHRRVVTYADEITARITSRYPAAEIASWPTQEDEARRVEAGATATEAPLLAMLAASAQMSLVDFAEAVLAKATGYRQVVAAVQATRSRAEALIGTCQSAGEIEVALATLRGEADAQAAAMGLAG